MASGLSEGLITYAEAFFSFNRLVDDGAGGKVAYRVHIEALARGGDPDAKHELASQPKLPKGAAHVWKYFQEVAETRGSSGFGPNPITRLEIRLWEEDEAVSLAPWERKAILSIDRHFLRAHYAKDETEAPADGGEEE